MSGLSHLLGDDAFLPRCIFNTKDFYEMVVWQPETRQARRRTRRQFQEDLAMMWGWAGPIALRERFAEKARVEDKEEAVVQVFISMHYCQAYVGETVITLRSGGSHH